jgi:hypothetical protein
MIRQDKLSWNKGRADAMLRLTLDVAAGVGQRVEALGALRRRAALPFI